MKKYFVGILSAAFILGAGTAVFAAGNSNSDNGISFEKMLPFMQKMHPDSTKAELKDMYKACHEENGMMNGTDGKDMKNMMNGTDSMDMNSTNMMNNL
ncbi:hypothetical protein [Neobacillus cucumis]|uniref:hypothetical protein n=1 Tax=Neobacillus cucumis TaxID=1740721 RepID=UPI0028532A13|nr:hypothetical protein [Neobacillus cucumis]MDR4949289.1 hypothetical protein [Neobacillus cucumis]